jgi:hypothetical protein
VAFDTNSQARRTCRLKGAMTLTMFAACVLISCEQTPVPSKDQSQETLPAPAVGNSSNRSRAEPTASSTGTPSALVVAARGDTLHPTDMSSASSGLQCTPAVFTLRDTITLRMEHPHGEYLMVTQPNGTPFYLAYPHPTEPPSYVLVSSDTFAEMPTIRFKAAIQSRPRVFGRDTLEAVFSKPGRYVLTIGHKLESEHASQIHKCTIRLASGE